MSLMRRLITPSVGVFSSGAFGSSSSVGLGGLRYASDDAASVFPRALQDALDQFAEARELISDASQSKGSVYFEEDKEDAVQQTEACIALWEAFKKDHASDSRLDKIVKEHDMKFKQLRAELDTLLDDDH